MSSSYYNLDKSSNVMICFKCVKKLMLYYKNAYIIENIFMIENKAFKGHLRKGNL